VLSRQPDAHDARASRYTLQEPLFRAWLESSGCVGEQEARVVAAVRLLGHIWFLDPQRQLPAPNEVAAWTDAARERLGAELFELDRSLARLGQALGHGEPGENEELPQKSHPAAGEMRREKEELPSLLLLAHQRREPRLFAHVAREMHESRCPLPVCSPPQWPVPVPEVLVPLMSQARGAALTWAASLAPLSEPGAEEILETLRGAPPSSGRQASAETVARLALYAAAPARAERLVQALGAHPSAIRAQRLSRQLRTREHGPLHVELEQLWQVVAAG
jgi:hypothetical protein